jgi:hypothetical protein
LNLLVIMVWRPPPPSGIVRHAPGDSSVYLKTKPVKSEFFMFIGFNPLTIIEFQIKKIFSCKINLQMSLESQLKRKKNPLWISGGGNNLLQICYIAA